MSEQPRPRSPKTFRFNYNDIAAITGLAVGTVRNQTGPRKVGSLAELLVWVNDRLRRRCSKPLSSEQVAQALASRSVETLGQAAAYLKDWRLRWPLLSVYQCHEVGCKSLVLGAPGLCAQHGMPAFRFNDTGHFAVLSAVGYVPYHDLLLEPARGYHVVHLDANPWNNRLENLEVVPD